MNYLFVHQNFPAQFVHVARHLAADPANRVVALCAHDNLQRASKMLPQVQIFAYPASEPGGKETHHYLRDYEGHVRRGQNVARAALQLRDQRQFQPDVVVVHPGWGEGLFLRDVFPQARHVHYLEYYYQGVGGDVGFDPEFPSSLDGQLKVRIKNSTQLIGLVACDQGISPTSWQKARYPAEFRSKISVIHEGVDTGFVKPDPQAELHLAGHVFRPGDEVVTYVARNLEPYRGFHTFIRSLPALQALRPNAHVVIVGGDGVSYGARLANGRTYREHYCAPLKDKVDWSKVHFTGQLPYTEYLKVLQVSALHTYLTYPFVLSWSMLESMAAGCLLLGSATTPVQEVIRDGENGLLVDFFDHEVLAQRIAGVLENPAEYAHLRAAARQTIIERYDLKTICLPQMLDFLKG